MPYDPPPGRAPQAASTSDATAPRARTSAEDVDRRVDQVFEWSDTVVDKMNTAFREIGALRTQVRDLTEAMEQHRGLLDRVLRRLDQAERQLGATARAPSPAAVASDPSRQRPAGSPAASDAARADAASVWQSSSRPAPAAARRPDAEPGSRASAAVMTVRSPDVRATGAERHAGIPAGGVPAPDDPRRRWLETLADRAIDVSSREPSARRAAECLASHLGRGADSGTALGKDAAAAHWSIDYLDLARDLASAAGSRENLACEEFVRDATGRVADLGLQSTLVAGERYGGWTPDHHFIARRTIVDAARRGQVACVHRPGYVWPNGDVLRPAEVDIYA